MESTSNNTPFQLDEPLRQRIDALARERGVSPADLLREALEKYAAHHEKTLRGDSHPIFERARAISESVPDEVWATLPRDLAANFDHYHYGHPRED